MSANGSGLPVNQPELMLAPFDHAEALQVDITQELVDAIANQELGGSAWWGLVNENFLDHALAGANVQYHKYIKEVTADAKTLDYAIRFIARVCSRPYADVALNVNHETVNDILDVFAEQPMPDDPFAKVILFIAVRGPYFQQVLTTTLTTARQKHEMESDSQKSGFTVTTSTRMER